LQLVNPSSAVNENKQRDSIVLEENKLLKNDVVVVDRMLKDTLTAKNNEVSHESWFALVHVEGQKRLAAGQVLLQVYFSPDFENKLHQTIDNYDEQNMDLAVEREGLLAEIRSGKKLKKYLQKRHLRHSHVHKDYFLE